MLRRGPRFFGALGIFDKDIQKLPRANFKPPDPLVLQLYREALKATAEFDWADEQGRLWRDVLRKSAREEFEMAREETDPFVLHQMIVTAKEAIGILKEKVILKKHELQQKLLSSPGDEPGRRPRA